MTKNRASLASLAGAATATGDAAKELLSSADALAQQSNALRSQVGGFIAEVRAAA